VHCHQAVECCTEITGTAADSGYRMTAAFDQLLQDFPSVQAAFGYGSGIFKQPSAAGSRHAGQPMLDFIFAVRDPQGWHEQVTVSSQLGLHVKQNDVWQYVVLE
jgi:Phosphatidate cytidylyltransferase, mitochondrial